MKTLSIAAGFATIAQAALAQTPVLTIYTYDSFVSEWGPGPAVEAAFEETCACDLRFVAVGDGAEHGGESRVVVTSIPRPPIGTHPDRSGIARVPPLPHYPRRRGVGRQSPVKRRFVAAVLALALLVFLAARAQARSDRLPDPAGRPSETG